MASSYLQEDHNTHSVRSYEVAIPFWGPALPLSRNLIFFKPLESSECEARFRHRLAPPPAEEPIARRPYLSDFPASLVGAREAGIQG